MEDRRPMAQQRPLRVLVISEIPTPYRLPLYRRLAARPELELEVLFCAREQPDRPWDIEGELGSVPHRFLAGFGVPLRTRRNTFVYEVNPGILVRLARTDFDLLVVGGYSVFAEQAALLYARASHTPYVLHSESHLGKSRHPLVAAAKRLVLPALVGGAAAGLATGSAAARYLAAYGLDPGRIRIVPNTIDVAAYGRAAELARGQQDAVRARWSLPDVYWVFAGRLVAAKGLDDLAAALRSLGADAPTVVVAGEGPLAGELERTPGIRLVGFRQRQELIELFAFARGAVLPSRDEPWGVVVNEALACGCPVVVSDAVGAAEDLVADGVNGRIVPAGDVDALARALAEPPPRASGGRIDRWTYDFAVEQFLEAVRLALPGRLPPIP